MNERSVGRLSEHIFGGGVCMVLLCKLYSHSYFNSVIWDGNEQFSYLNSFLQTLVLRSRRCNSYCILVILQSCLEFYRTDFFLVQSLMVVWKKYGRPWISCESIKGSKRRRNGENELCWVPCIGTESSFFTKRIHFYIKYY